MSKKLKFNPTKNRYRLHLTEDELFLVTKLLAHVVLGDDTYGRAASSLIGAIETGEGNGVLNKVHDDMTLTVSTSPHPSQQEWLDCNDLSIKVGGR